MTASYSKLLTIHLIAACSICTLFGLFLSGRMKTMTADSPRYLQLAENLYEHGVLSASPEAPFQPEIQRVPGYALFLTGLKSLGIESARGIAGVQVVLHALMTIVIACLTPRYKIITAWAFALFPYSIYHCFQIASEGLSEVFLLFGLFVFSLALRHENRARTFAILSGISFTALMYTRPVFLFLPLAIVIGHVLVYRKGSTGGLKRSDLVLFLLFGIVPAIPWIARSSAIAGRPLPMAMNWSGYNLYLATMDYRVDKDKFESGEYFIDFGDKVSILDQWDLNKVLHQNDAYQKLAIERIKADPSLFFAESLWRTVRVWLTWEIVESSNKNLRWLSPFLLITTVLMFSLGLVGAWILRHDAISTLTLSLPCIYVSAMHAFLHVSGRYSAPARGILLILAVHAFLTIIYRIAGRNQNQPAPGQ